jgi:hypothetical protein
VAEIDVKLSDHGKYVDPIKRVDRFHDHLEECERCMNKPFDLCPNGRWLLHSAGQILRVEHVDNAA